MKPFILFVGFLWLAMLVGLYFVYLNRRVPMDLNGKLKNISPRARVIVITDDDGDEFVRSLHDDVEVTLNGSDATLGDLKPGHHVSLSGDPVTSIEAKSK